MGDYDGGNVITITFVDNRMGDNIVTGEDGMIIDQGGPGNPRPAGVLLLPASMSASLRPSGRAFWRTCSAGGL